MRPMHHAPNPLFSHTLGSLPILAYTKCRDSIIFSLKFYYSVMVHIPSVYARLGFRAQIKNSLDIFGGAFTPLNLDPATKVLLLANIRLYLSNMVGSGH